MRYDDDDDDFDDDDDDDDDDDAGCSLSAVRLESVRGLRVRLQPPTETVLRGDTRLYQVWRPVRYRQEPNRI